MLFTCDLFNFLDNLIKVSLLFQITIYFTLIYTQQKSCSLYSIDYYLYNITGFSIILNQRSTNHFVTFFPHLSCIPIIFCLFFLSFFYVSVQFRFISVHQSRNYLALVSFSHCLNFLLFILRFRFQFSFHKFFLYLFFSNFFLYFSFGVDGVEPVGCVA